MKYGRRRRDRGRRRGPVRTRWKKLNHYEARTSSKGLVPEEPKRSLVARLSGSPQNLSALGSCCLDGFPRQSSVLLSSLGTIFHIFLFCTQQHPRLSHHCLTSASLGFTCGLTIWNSSSLSWQQPLTPWDPCFTFRISGCHTHSPSTEDLSSAPQLPRGLQPGLLWAQISLYQHKEMVQPMTCQLLVPWSCWAFSSFLPL